MGVITLTKLLESLVEYVENYDIINNCSNDILTKSFIDQVQEYAIVLSNTAERTLNFRYDRLSKSSL